MVASPYTKALVSTSESAGKTSRLTYVVVYRCQVTVVCSRTTEASSVTRAPPTIFTRVPQCVKLTHTRYVRCAPALTVVEIHPTISQEEQLTDARYLLI